MAKWTDETLKEFENAFSDQEALDRAVQELGEVCKGGRFRFRMSIPVDPELDTDCIIGLALRRFHKLLRKEFCR
jgi:hypothetical protein